MPEPNFCEALPFGYRIDFNFRTSRKNLAGVRIHAASSFGKDNVIGENSRPTALKENETVIEPVWFGEANISVDLTRISSCAQQKEEENARGNSFHHNYSEPPNDGL